MELQLELPVVEEQTPSPEKEEGVLLIDIAEDSRSEWVIDFPV
jgi:hypothetical protein